MKVRIKRLHPEAILPRYQTDGSAGCDLHARISHYRYSELPGELAIAPGDRVVIPTGIAIELPPGYEAQVRPRSGLQLGRGVVGLFGTVDADYRGEISVGLVSLRRQYFTVRHGDRIAQLVIAPVIQAEWEEVDALSETIRGAGGFGSTGR